MSTITAAEYRSSAKAPKQSKYRNIPVVVDGRRFDSKREAAYHAELLIREKAGEVGGVEMQRPFPLIGPDGLLITTYRADFAFWDYVADRFRVVDVKGGKVTQTDSFRIKRKMMKSFLGINVEVVT